MKTINKIFFFLLASVMLFGGCSTKKNAFLNRAYHDLAARDNGYFNAKIKIAEGAEKLASSVEDRYDRILKIFKYGDAEKAKGIASTMDEAIKKSSLVISRHSMLINGVEHCRWIDDNYLIIGKADFYKRDYFPAIETFQYVIAQYKDQDSRYEALLWLMKVYLEQNNFEDAENVMDYMNSESKFPKYLRADLAATSASYYLAQKNYTKTIDQLTKAIKLPLRRAEKTRYMFILAQLYQKEQENKKAYALYGEVIKRNPIYEMAFNAKINQARTYDLRSGKSETVKKQLHKMLKDEKNKEYLDQVYYALGTIALQEKNQPEAVVNFKKSVRASTINSGQKALSFLELGNIYFGKPDYRMAQVYFDSTIAFISKDHPDYEDILSKRNSLNKLVKFYKTIELEDSLQKLAALSPKERDAVIEATIKRKEEEAARKKKEEEEKKAQNALMAQNSATSSSSANMGSGASWYFYNPSSVSFGYNDFVKKWGNRPNEDNWRRSNKEAVQTEAAEATADTASGKSDTSKTKTTEKDKYYSTIPLGPKQLEKSTTRIIEAYYGISLIYKEQLSDNGESAKAGEELLRRFPENSYKLPMYYNLYLVYKAMNNMERSDYYKNLLLNNYAESDYAQIIIDPDYIQNSKNRNAKLNAYYQETYLLFGKGELNEVLKRKDEAEKLFPGNKLAPKFDYLRTLVIGKTKGIDQFETSLKEIIAKYPKDEVKDKAQETLEFLAEYRNRKDVPGTTAPAEKEAPKDLYVINPDTIHYCVLQIHDNDNFDKLKGKITAYDVKNYGNSPFKLDEADVAGNYKFLVIKQFSDKDAAQDYFYGIKQDMEVAAYLKGINAQQFVITDRNLKTLMVDKDLAKYMLFYKINYPDIPHF